MLLPPIALHQTDWAIAWKVKPLVLSLVIQRSTDNLLICLAKAVT